MQKLRSRRDIISVTVFLCVANLILGLVLEGRATDGYETVLMPSPIFAVTSLLVPIFILYTFIYSFQLNSQNEKTKGREIFIGAIISLAIFGLAVGSYVGLSIDFFGYS